MKYKIYVYNSIYGYYQFVTLKESLLYVERFLSAYYIPRRIKYKIEI